MVIRICFFTLIVLFAACAWKPPVDLQTGDIIFQISRSSQSRAIQQATHSPYSHVGIVMIKNEKPYVYEASLNVHYIPLGLWVVKGINGEYVVKRLKKSHEILTPARLSRMEQEANRHKGKPYDYGFSWSDQKLYCSELVWKIYERSTGLHLGEPRPLKQYDLAFPAVRIKLRERYGDKIPMEEPMISPAALFDCDLLDTVAIQRN
jgi:hypothetical protein